MTSFRLLPFTYCPRQREVLDRLQKDASEQLTLLRQHFDDCFFTGLF